MTHLVNYGIAVKFSFDDREHSFGLKIFDDEFSCTKIQYIDFDDEENIYQETNLDNVKYFKNFITGEIINVCKICDTYSKAFVTTEEMVDIERYVSSLKQNKKMYSAKLVEFKRRVSVINN